MHKVLNQAMHQTLKTQVLEIVVQKALQIQEHLMQAIAVLKTAHATQLEIATNF
jgi:hypothetical protein